MGYGAKMFQRPDDGKGQKGGELLAMFSIRVLWY